MVEVIALHSFTHGGESFKRNQQWEEKPDRAEAFRKAGLVKIRDNRADPQSGTGVKLSASPAAPASTKQTSKKSASGGRRKKAEQSS